MPQSTQRCRTGKTAEMVKGRTPVFPFSPLATCFPHMSATSYSIVSGPDPHLVVHFLVPSVFARASISLLSSLTFSGYSAARLSRSPMSDSRS